MSLLTTRVEVVTEGGSRASLDKDGWHSAEPKLLEALQRDASLHVCSGDPLYKAAQRAAEKCGVRIVLLKRGAADMRIGATSKLFRALTESSLQKVINGPQDDDGAETRIIYRNLRLLWAAILLLVGGVGLVIGAFLAR